jgi:xylulokinase
MRLISEAFQEQGIDTPDVRIIGGGARSRLWCKIFSDILEKPIMKLNFIEEATSVGAAIAGGIGVGMFPSIEDAAKLVKIEDKAHPETKNFPIYRSRYKIFKKSYEQLVDVFSQMEDS